MGEERETKAAKSFDASTAPSSVTMDRKADVMIPVAPYGPGPYLSATASDITNTPMEQAHRKGNTQAKEDDEVVPKPRATTFHRQRSPATCDLETADVELVQLEARVDCHSTHEGTATVLSTDPNTDNPIDSESAPRCRGPTRMIRSKSSPLSNQSTHMSLSLKATSTNTTPLDFGLVWDHRLLNNMSILQKTDDEVDHVGSWPALELMAWDLRYRMLNHLRREGIQLRQRLQHEQISRQGWLFSAQPQPRHLFPPSAVPDDSHKNNNSNEGDNHGSIFSNETTISDTAATALSATKSSNKKRKRELFHPARMA